MSHPFCSLDPCLHLSPAMQSFYKKIEARVFAEFLSCLVGSFTCDALTKTFASFNNTSTLMQHIHVDRGHCFSVNSIQSNYIHSHATINNGHLYMPFLSNTGSRPLKLADGSTGCERLVFHLRQKLGNMEKGIAYLGKNRRTNGRK